MTWRLEDSLVHHSLLFHSIPWEGHSSLCALAKVEAHGTLHWKAVGWSCRETGVRHHLPKELSKELKARPLTCLFSLGFAGYAAFINQWESMLLGALQELLKGKERDLELTRLMTRISWKVAVREARGQHSGGKEMPCFVTTMLKEVYPFAQKRHALDHEPAVLPASPYHVQERTQRPALERT